MPDKFEIALTEKLTRMCVVKEGATTYYVDGVTGNDGANGLTWESAKKTIQAAVDIADLWADIYIADDTYYERVKVPATKPNLSFYGESKENTLIHGRDGGGGDFYAIAISASGVSLHNVHLDSYVHSFSAGAGTAIFDGCQIGARGILSGDYNVLHKCDGIKGMASITGSRNIVIGCIIGAFGQEVATAITICGGANYNYVYDNEFQCDCYRGVTLCDDGTKAEHNTITHNSFVDVSIQALEDDGANNDIFENYYSDHTNVDNGSGIANAAYAIAGTAGNSDPRPVIVRNGWLAQALSGVNANAITDLTGRTVSGNTGAIAHNVETACSAILGQSGKRAILQGGIVRGIQDGLAAGKKLTLRVYKYNGAAWDKVDDYDVTKDSGLEANIGHVAHDDYIKVAVLHDDTSGTKTFYYKFIIQDMEE